MGLNPNPIVSDQAAELRFSEHASFRMDERDIDKNTVVKLLFEPRAEYKIDAKSGNYVFRKGEYTVVVRKTKEGLFTVLSVFTDDQGAI